jgi:hypothetical protein
VLYRFHKLNSLSSNLLRRLVGYGFEESSGETSGDQTALWPHRDENTYNSDSLSFNCGRLGFPMVRYRPPVTRDEVENMSNADVFHPVYDKIDENDPF